MIIIPWLFAFSMPPNVSDVTCKRALVTSDFHGKTEAVHKTALKAKAIEADVIVVCGDVTQFGSVKDAQRVFAPLLASEIPLLYVLGNCDSPELAKAEIVGAVNLHGTCKVLKNVSFLGLGGSSPTPFNTLFELTEPEIMEILHRGVKDCSHNKWFAILSHDTPKDTRVDLTWTNRHVGSVSLRKFIEEQKPHVVFCGHIHEAPGIDHIGETLVVNPGPTVHGRCAIANLNDKIEATLTSL
jgi:Icc-related predicted phosphoesterase